MIVDRLIRQRHEIARPDPRLGRDVETSGCSLKDGYAHHVADSQLDLRRRAIVSKSPRKGKRAVFIQEINDTRSKADEPIGRPVPR